MHVEKFTSSVALILIKLDLVVSEGNLFSSLFLAPTDLVVEKRRRKETDLEWKVAEYRYQSQ